MVACQGNIAGSVPCALADTVHLVLLYFLGQADTQRCCFLQGPAWPQKGQRQTAPAAVPLLVPMRPAVAKQRPSSGQALPRAAAQGGEPHAAPSAAAHVPQPEGLVQAAKRSAPSGAAAQPAAAPADSPSASVAAQTAAVVELVADEDSGADVQGTGRAPLVPIANGAHNRLQELPVGKLPSTREDQQAAAIPQSDRKRANQSPASHLQSDSPATRRAVSAVVPGSRETIKSNHRAAQSAATGALMVKKQKLQIQAAKPIKTVLSDSDDDFQ